MIIGYTTGVFDLFHVGHLNILRRSKEKCDYLIVGVSTDELVSEYKHKIPLIPFEERKVIVEAIRYVDKVVPQISMDKLAAWQQLNFDIMFHGDDWKGTYLYKNYEEQLANVGVKLIYLPHTKNISSTIIFDRLYDLWLAKGRKNDEMAHA